MTKKLDRSIPLIYILLRNRNAYKLSKTAISSLSQLSYKNFRIVLIDDGSEDNSALRLKREFPELKLLRTKRYLEYCKSFNFGIDYALKRNAKYIFVVNNDTKDFSVNYLEEVVSAFRKDKRIGLVGSWCYDYDGNIRWEGKVKMKFGIPMDTPTEGFVVKSEVFKKVGLLNENLVRYFEDLDLIVRLRKAGYKSKTVHSVSFAHLGGGTSSKQIFVPNFYRTRNILLFIKKHCQDEKFIWKVEVFKVNIRVHINRLLNAFYRRQFIRFFKLLLSIGLGLLIGSILPWRENVK